MITNKLSIVGYFKDLKDPRKHQWKCEHNFYEIIAVTITAVICGMKGWEEIEAFAQAKRKWLKKKLNIKFKKGIPSADTFRRIISSIKPNELQKAFIDWIQAVQKSTDGAVISIDGKTVRRSYDKAKDTKALHMIGAWVHANGVSLGQIATEVKSNEITAIPKLLEMLVIKKCIIVIDAEGCQKKIALCIKEQEGDYVLALKCNQRKLFNKVKLFFDNDFKDHKNPANYYETKAEKGHGRIEKRFCSVALVKNLGLAQEGLEQWAGLTSIIMVESRVQHLSTKQTTMERRFYISSLDATANNFLNYIRGHWGIETSLHWILDVVMREDDSRIRADHGAVNFSVLRRAALNYLREEKSNNKSIKSKQLRASLDDEYLEKVLQLC